MITIIKNIYNYLYQQMLKYKSRVGWTLALIVAVTITFFYVFDVFERLELMTLDYRFNLRPMHARPSDIVFIDMAEDSIDAIGRWPWPRKWHATLIKALSDYKPKVIAFDVIFSEPQDELDDAALEEAMKESGVVYMPLLYNLEALRMRDLHAGEGVTSALRPIERFESKLKGTGHINAMPDSDGILRRVPLVITFQGRKTYQLGMQIGMDLLGLKDGDVSVDADKHVITLKLPNGEQEKIPLDARNQLIIDWAGRWGREFRHFSYIDVIRSYAAIKEGKKPLINLKVFKNKICIVGLTASGLIDIKPIPIEPAYPAVGTNAMVVNSILNKAFIYDIPKEVNAFILIVLSVLVTLYLCNLRLLGGMLFTIICMIAYAVFSILLFVLFNIVIVTFYPIFSIFISYVLTASYTQILQSVERARLFRQATRDGLTHLYNIRHFNLLLEAEMRNAAIYKNKKLSVIMGDLDNFKQANDTYGHQAGDVILREVAAIMESKCRQTDIVGRYGGEEFIVMLAGADEKAACEVAEKIRAAVEAKHFKFKAVTYSTTVSMGVAEYSGEKVKEELVERADSALYRAKREGKNRFCIAKRA